MAHTFDPTILREYDIRGIYGETLFDQDAFVLGGVLAQIIKEKGGSKAVIGYDGRESSPVLCDFLTKGFEAGGVDVTHIGLCPSPVVYYTVFEHEFDGGVAITGSHNPKDYNGFKMMIGRDTLHGSYVQDLGQRAKQMDLPAISDQSNAAFLDIVESYLTRLLQDLGRAKPLKVAWDTGNGSTGDYVTRLIQKLPGNHMHLYAEIDGTFPNHHPDPTVEENLEDLKKLVLENGCDLGIGFDGDGDRIGVIDNKGRMVWGDQLMAIYARDVLSKNPGSPVIADIKSSQVLFNEIDQLGGKPVMARSGHSLIKAKMKEHNAPLAGEMSGHIFFADSYYGFDDALYAAVRLLKILSESSQNLAQMRDSLPQMVNTPEIRFPCDEDRKFKIIEEISQKLQTSAADISKIDGVRVSYEEGWWLLRASNTQSVLSARFEGKNQEFVQKLKSECANLLQQLGIDPPEQMAS